MNQLSIDEIKEKIIPIMRAEGVTRASLFGSRVRGDHREDSDVDVLVEMPQNKSLFDFVGLKLKIEDSLKQSVDLVEYDSVKPALQNSILQNQILLYEK